MDTAAQQGAGEKCRLVLAVARYPDAPGACTWVWGLYPQNAEHTRLVTRLHWRAHTAFGRLMLDAFEIWMMRKHLLGIKQRVEAQPSR